tara:strand:- start:177 stop:1613 length:1437 start_codon:yes stop_codon:yes gene_type:complete
MVSFSTKFFRKNKFLIFLFLICLFTRVSSSINYFEDIDSLRFGLSASEFNILESRPHFPGYAVFCFLLRTIFEIINNIGISFSIIGGVSLFMIIYFSQKIIDIFHDLNKIFFTILILFNPFLWLMSNRYMPDLLGVALLCAGLFYFLKIIEEKKIKDYLIFGLIIGLQCGVRLSYIPFFLPAVILLSNKKVFYSIISFLLGFFIWAIPLILITGFDNIITIFKNDFHGHFYRWGGTILSSEASLATRFYNVIEFIFVDGFSFWKNGRNWTTIINSFFISIFVISFCKNLQYDNFKKFDSHIKIIICCFFSYFVWIFLFQNINYKPRHIMPFIPAIAALIAYGASFSSQKNYVNIIVFIIFLIPHIYITNKLITQHKEKSAISQITNFMNNISEEKVILFSDGLKIFYFNKTISNKKVKLVNLNRRDDNLTKEYINKGYRVYSTIKLNELNYVKHKKIPFYHNPFVNRLWSQLNIYHYE